MRRLALFCFGVLLIVPATAGAMMIAVGDGTLFVRNGDGHVRLKLASGVVLGRIAEGKLEVVDPLSECEDLLVWDADVDFERAWRGVRGREGVTCVFKVGRDPGTAIRFRLSGGEGEIRMYGRGLWFSAVGRGKSYLRGSQTRFRDGAYSLNNGRFVGLPDEGEWVKIEAPVSLP